MVHSKIIVAEELIALAKEVLDVSVSVRRDRDDDELEAGYKEGLKDAYAKVDEMIYSRLEKILRESKQK